MAETMTVEEKVETVKKAVALIEWLDNAPAVLMGTRALEQVWDQSGGIVEEALEVMEAEKYTDESGFVCYDEEDGPKNELREWLEKVIGEETQREAMEEYKLAVLVHEALEAMGDPGEEDE